MTTSWLLSFDHAMFQLPVILFFFQQLTQAGCAGFAWFLHCMEVANVPAH